jgi:hypothetical protein
MNPGRRLDEATGKAKLVQILQVEWRMSLCFHSLRCTARKERWQQEVYSREANVATLEAAIE